MNGDMLQNRISKVLFDKEAIRTRIKELGAAIREDYRIGGPARKECNHPPMMVCVLHGALVFTADLVRQIDLEIEYDFICVDSYGNGTSPGAVRLIKDLERPLRDRDVLIVEDIIDTGHTIQYIKRAFAARDPASLRVCTLVDKRVRRQVSVPIDYTGFVLDQDEFIVGYGMDYAGLYRNLPFIAVLKPEFIQ